MYVLHLVLFAQVFFIKMLDRKGAFKKLPCKVLARVVCLWAWGAVFAGDPISLARNNVIQITWKRSILFFFSYMDFLDQNWA